MAVLIMISTIYSELTRCQAQYDIGYLVDYAHTHTHTK